MKQFGSCSGRMGISTVTLGPHGMNDLARVNVASFRGDQNVRVGNARDDQNTRDFAGAVGLLVGNDLDALARFAVHISDSAFDPDGGVALTSWPSGVCASTVTRYEPDCGSGT